jgi:hypothetical protein
MEHWRTPRTHLADIDHGNMDGNVKTVESSGSGLDTDKLGCTVNLQPPSHRRRRGHPSAQRCR